MGRRYDSLCSVDLNGGNLDRVDQWVYLGVCLMSGKSFGCSVTERIKIFIQKCANAIFGVEGRLNDMVMLGLIESHCIPILTYAIEIVQLVHVLPTTQFFVGSLDVVSMEV